MSRPKFDSVIHIAGCRARLRLPIARQRIVVRGAVPHRRSPAVHLTLLDSAQRREHAHL